MTPPDSASPAQEPLHATRWLLRTQVLDLPRIPRLMGIVNVTPDSFSDGGQFFSAERAIEHGLRLADEGADLLDVGGESTRPYSTPIEALEEWRRVERVVQALVRQTNIPVSIDTSKASVARAALDAGAEIVNDVTGLTGDPEMLPLVLAEQPGVCAMHMQGTPQTMQDHPHYDDVVAEISAYLGERRDALRSAGLHPERICLDPGIGFGKTHAHNVTLLTACHRFHRWGSPLLVGYSRKGFIGKLLGDPGLDRVFGNVGVGLALARQGVQILRVHDVGATRQALRLFEAAGGLDLFDSPALSGDPEIINNPRS